MRTLFKTLIAALTGAALTTFIAFVSARPFWPVEIGFGKQPGDYFSFFSFTAVTGSVLGAVTGLTLVVSPPKRAKIAPLLFAASVTLLLLVAPAEWILEENAAWPLLRGSSEMTSQLADFGPFIICWFPMLWAIGLAVWSYRIRKTPRDLRLEVREGF